MNFDTLRQTLETTFNTAWGVTTPIAWQNVGEDIPHDSPWVRFSIVPRHSQNVVIGSDIPRLVGFIAVQIFVPLDTGLGTAYSLADSVLDVLQNKSISGIFTYAAHVENVGEGIRRIKDVEQGFHQLNVAIPYEAQT